MWSVQDICELTILKGNAYCRNNEDTKWWEMYDSIEEEDEDDYVYLSSFIQNERTGMDDELEVMSATKWEVGDMLKAELVVHPAHGGWAETVWFEEFKCTGEDEFELVEDEDLVPDYIDGGFGQ